MKLIRKQARKIAIMLSLSLLFVSCSQYDDSITPTNELQKTLKSTSGEEIFKSIFFADGTLTNQISALKDISASVQKLSVKELNDYRATQVKYLNHLKSLDSNYFTNFKNAVASKDINRIDFVLKKAATDLSNFVKKSNKNVDVEKLVKQYGESNVDFSTNKEMGVALILIVTVAIAILIVAAATMAYVKVEVVDRVSSEAVNISQKESSMIKQQFIVDIINLK